MKIVKWLLYIVLGLIALFLIAGLFMDNEYKVKREVVINKPKGEVFEYIKHIKNQDAYSVWNRKDPNKKQTFMGTDGTEGFIYAWDGNDDVGAGEQEIKSITEGSRIDMELRFKRPMEATGQAYMTTEDAGPGSTKVTWGVVFVNKYPMNAMNPIFTGMLGKDLQDGLNNMKKNLESK